MQTDLINAAAMLIMAPIAPQRRFSGKVSTIVPGASLVAILALAFNFYTSPAKPDAAAVEAPGTARRPDTGAPAQGVSAAPVANLVDGLAERLRQDPDDAGGWLLLARSYRFLDRAPEASAAYRHAANLGLRDEELERYLGSRETAGDDLEEVRDWLNSDAH